MIENAAGASILGRAAKNGYIGIHTVQIRDFSVNKHNRVDDYPYGGGAGMVMEAEPVYRAVNSALSQCGAGTRVVYLTPQGRRLDQGLVEEFAAEKDLVLLCGHYEGIDERALEECVTDYVSIGDYVLTGGELGALVLIDAVSRFVPGVLSNEESSEFESLQDNLLEYPHYTRPAVWRGREVPAVLLTGDHRKIEMWRYEHSLERTRERRPDLLESRVRAHVLWMGQEKFREQVEDLSEGLSRYGVLMDYNRRKLQKQKPFYGSRDMLIFFLLEDPDPEEFKEAVRNLKGRDTGMCLFTYGDPEIFGQILEENGFVLESCRLDPDLTLKEQCLFSLRKKLAERIRKLNE